MEKVSPLVLGKRSEASATTSVAAWWGGGSREPRCDAAACCPRRRRGRGRRAAGRGGAAAATRTSPAAPPTAASTRPAALPHSTAGRGPGKLGELRVDGESRPAGRGDSRRGELKAEHRMPVADVVLGGEEAAERLSRTTPTIRIRVHQAAPPSSATL